MVEGHFFLILLGYRPIFNNSAMNLFICCENSDEDFDLNARVNCLSETFGFGQSFDEKLAVFSQALMVNDKQPKCNCK
jgi:hypothetical protein